jgi:hypothetical protein
VANGRRSTVANDSGSSCAKAGKALQTNKNTKKARNIIINKLPKVRTTLCARAGFVNAP